ncbi:MAG: metallophosphoesterase [Chitinophagaceae bacterium]|nr:metallophosphoesterase [Chitinophagaceae bacterium]
MKLYFIGLILMIISCSAAIAQPKGVHLSWNGEKEVKTATTMAITWLNEKQDESRVQYGMDNKKLISAKASVKYSNDLKAYVSKATLTNLKPATYYYYKVGSDEAGWSQLFRFRTGPVVGDKSKIVVGVWSDTQNNGGNYNFEQTDSIVKEMEKNAFYFTIHNGDIVENGSVVKSWKDLFNVTEPISANHPFMSVTGNHDVVNNDSSVNFQKPFPVFYDIVNLPGNELNYSYDYGNTHFIAINSGYSQGAEIKKKPLFFEAGSEEYRWLEDDLKKAKQNKKINWIILYSHYPVYSWGVSQILTWQAHLKPLIDKYEIDLVLSGHRHAYERHKAVRGSEIFEQKDFHVYNNPKGTVYITNGSSGGHLQGVGGWDLPTMVFTPKVNSYNFAMMTIEGNKINYHVFDKEGKEIDYFELVKTTK